MADGSESAVADPVRVPGAARGSGVHTPVTARYPGGMAPDAKLMMIVGVLHLIGVVLATGLLVMFVRTDTAGSSSQEADDGDGGHGGGGNDRVHPRAPSGPRGGGIPLPDAIQSRVRLRGPERLTGGRGLPRRRRTVEPARRRSPARGER